MYRIWNRTKSIFCHYCRSNTIFVTHEIISKYKVVWYYNCWKTAGPRYSVSFCYCSQSNFLCLTWYNLETIKSWVYKFINSQFHKFSKKIYNIKKAIRKNSYDHLVRSPLNLLQLQSNLQPFSQLTHIHNHHRKHTNKCMSRFCGRWTITENKPLWKFPLPFQCLVSHKRSYILKQTYSFLM